jgi:uncharacterized protein YndB with AHSA1/START domain
MGKTEVIIEPGRQDIVIKHTFDAPRDLVFKVYTDPSLIPNWYGPRAYEAIVDKMDVRVGGQWRFLNRDDQGNEFGFKGVYHDVVAPERIVQTFEFEGVPGHVALETLTLEELDGKTVAIATSVFQSLADRDGMVQSGLEGGARETYERLDELLAGMLSRA